MKKKKTIENNKIEANKASKDEVSIKMIRIGIIFSISSAALLIYVLSEKIFNVS
tara:strand:- start:433 stop:594 length:162 start_codon:yes stop_codon:yes gene_type:complete